MPSSPHPLPPGRTVHLCIDMQQLFREGPWCTPWMERVLPNVRRIVAAHAAETVFTRFIPPERPEALPGRWAHFYEHWRALTREVLDARQLQLVEELAPTASRGAPVVDKSRYSPFFGTDLHRLLQARGATTLVMTGTETDVCILAAALDAIDHGYGVVIVRDAVCSANDRSHDAMMTLYSERFSKQVDLVETEALLAHWPASA